MSNIIELIGKIQNTPVPAIFVIAGVLLLLLCLVDQIGSIIRLPANRRAIAAITGLIFLFFGVLLFISPTLTSEAIEKKYIGSRNDETNNINGMWICTSTSQYRITWMLKFVSKEGRFSAEGTKSLINGKVADSIERKTIWKLDGRIKSLKSTGTYFEASPFGANYGTFDITFSKDERSFSGFLKNPSGTMVASFQGDKIQY